MDFSSFEKKIHSALFKEIKNLSPRPCQKKALKQGLLEKSNILVCSPTASGKTLVAEIAAINSILKTGKKAIYIVPLKSLASEKYDEFKEKYEKIGIKIGISIGDLDSKDPWLKNKDLIIATSEKMDSLIRHNASWISQINIAVIDEIHLMNDESRGPTLEVLITALKKRIKNIQVISLSATIGNPRELADWLDAELVYDEWRPVKLSQAVFFEDKITLKKSQKISLEKDELFSLVKYFKEKGLQMLVFCPTKKTAESSAEKASAIFNSNLEDEKSKILSALPQPTKQCKKLAKCIEKGVAFHHAGLVNSQKKLIENSFRKRKVKAIFCTPTLAMGLNLPADIVIMKSLKRFSKRFGNAWIPVLEYHQMTGRAGRPQSKSKEGLAVSIAKTEAEKEIIEKKYINGKPEPILSKLAVEPILRQVILALVASNIVADRKGLLKFFKSTFYGFQFGDDWTFEDKILSVLKTLKQNSFIKEKNHLEATKLGKRVSQLYIDPETAIKMINALKMEKGNTFTFLQLVCNTLEMRPLVRAKAKDLEKIEDLILMHKENLLTNLPNEWDYNYDFFIDSVKTANLLYDWISEKSEEDIMLLYRIRPGELKYKIDNSNWLLYAMSELAKIINKKDSYSKINKLRIRIKNGIKEELLPLVKIRGIGRFRARLLYNNGIRTISEIKKAEPEKIARIIKSVAIAKKIKQEVGQKIKHINPVSIKEGQVKLSDF